MFGAKPESSFAEPLGLIDDCHRRIEQFLDLFGAVLGQAQGRGLNERQRQALERAQRYFRDAAPRHIADEEISLFPRLLSVAGPEAETIAALVNALRTDHASLDGLHAELDGLVSHWLVADALTPAELQRYLILVETLTATYQRHLLQEEQQLLPLARHCLSPALIEAIGREMALRRGLDYDALAAFAADGATPRADAHAGENRLV